ncbi:MAG: hypothetical protein CVU38_18025, partial [Chloroflexi bacterium HGW-Chloroflexi-1]
MTPEELLALIAGGEGETIEFKRSVAELEKAVETVAAFANTRGGVVLIGVGQTTRERIVNRITGNTDPAIYPSVEHVTAQGRVVVAITVLESADKPHLAFGRAFKRVGAVTAQMDRAEYERLLLARRQLPFDRREVSDATTDDLDAARLLWYLQRAAQERGIPVDLAAPLAENLKRLGVAAERNGRLVLTTTALLLFGKRPQQFLSYTMVRIARFQGTTPLNFIDRLDCFGTLPEMIDEA